MRSLGFHLDLSPQEMSDELTRLASLTDKEIEEYERNKSMDIHQTWCERHSVLPPHQQNVVPLYKDLSHEHIMAAARILFPNGGNPEDHGRASVEKQMVVFCKQNHIDVGFVRDLDELRQARSKLTDRQIRLNREVAIAKGLSPKERANAAHAIKRNGGTFKTKTSSPPAKKQPVGKTYGELASTYLKSYKWPNPKRGKSAARYEGYVDRVGQSLQQILKETELTKADVQWDMSRNLIETEEKCND